LTSLKSGPGCNSNRDMVLHGVVPVNVSLENRTSYFVVVKKDISRTIVY